MSVTFDGFRKDFDKGCDGDVMRIVRLSNRPEDDVGFNMANGNACAFLAFLGLPAEPDGILPLADMRRVIIKARATFDRNVDAHTREPSSSGHVVIDGVTHLDIPRFHQGGIDASYFERRLAEFATLVEDVAAEGATHIGWG